jgi:transcriptional regulator with XRE-family HTH domain
MTDLQLYRMLGQIVAKRRKELGLTQVIVAEHAGLTRAALANIETGRQKVLLHQVCRLVDALKLKSITDLVPAVHTFNQGPSRRLTFNGGSITAAQRAKLRNMIRLALIEARGMTKR